MTTHPLAGAKMKPNDYTKRQRIDAIKMALVMSIERLEERGAILTSRKVQRCIIHDIRSTVEGAAKGEISAAISELRTRAKETGDDHFGLILRRLVV
jgi:hypothetical protein